MGNGSGPSSRITGVRPGTGMPISTPVPQITQGAGFGSLTPPRGGFNDPEYYPDSTPAAIAPKEPVPTPPVDYTSPASLSTRINELVRNSSALDQQLIDLDTRYQTLSASQSQGNTLSSSDTIFVMRDYAGLRKSLVDQSVTNQAQIDRLIPQLINISAKQQDKGPTGPSPVEIKAFEALTLQRIAETERAKVETARLQKALDDETDPLSPAYQTKRFELEIAKAKVEGLQSETAQKASLLALGLQLNSGEITLAQYENSLPSLASSFNEVIAIQGQRATQAFQSKTLELQVQQADLAAELGRGGLEVQNRNAKTQEDQLAQAQRNAEAQARQAQVQNVQSLSALQTRRQEAANQAMTSFEQYGVATPGRIASLNELRAPLPAGQAAAMLGMSAEDPEFQKVWGTYNKALTGTSPGEVAGNPQGTPEGTPPVPVPGGTDFSGPAPLPPISTNQYQGFSPFAAGLGMPGVQTPAPGITGGMGGAPPMVSSFTNGLMMQRGLVPV